MRQRRVTLFLVALGLLTLVALALADIAWSYRSRRWCSRRSPTRHWPGGCGARCTAQELLLDSLADGISSLHDADYSISIAEPRDAKWRKLVTAYNALGGRLRRQRQDLYQRELLLDTVIQASPLALLLTNATGTILYANLAARQLLPRVASSRACARALLEPMPPSLREAFVDKRDTAVHRDDQERCRGVPRLAAPFLLNGQPHRLRLLKQLTREVNAQEVATWKTRDPRHRARDQQFRRADRVARAVGPAPRAGADEAQLSACSARSRSACRTWRGSSTGIRASPSCRGRAPRTSTGGASSIRCRPSRRSRSMASCRGETGWFDESQLEQVMINLLKNAAEAGSPPSATIVSVAPRGRVRRSRCATAAPA